MTSDIDDIEAERSAEIDAHRATLADALNDAAAGLRTAQHAFKQLAGDDGVYDVEYAETETGHDLRAVLADAARSIRIAGALRQKIES